MAHKRNCRNDVLCLENLLESACRTLDEYFPNSDVVPYRVREWWRARKNAEIKERILRSEAGVADAAIQQIITLESEMGDSC